MVRKVAGERLDVLFLSYKALVFKAKALTGASRETNPIR